MNGTELERIVKNKKRQMKRAIAFHRYVFQYTK